MRVISTDFDIENDWDMKFKLDRSDMILGFLSRGKTEAEAEVESQTQTHSDVTFRLRVRLMLMKN